MYKEKIVASLANLAEGELKALWERIQFDFSPDFGEKEEKMSMLRDDIADKLLFLMVKNFEWIEEPLNEHENLKDDLDLEETDLTVLSCEIQDEFDIDFITPDDIDKWNTVADIVNYIEDVLECALHDMEEE